MIDVIILTYGRSRASAQHTLKQLNEDGIKPIMLVQDRERHMYDWLGDKADLRVLPPAILTVSPTRDWIIHDMQGCDKVVCLDDDLHFAVRREDDPTKFRQPKEGDLQMMLARMESALDVYPHVSIGSREGGNRNVQDVLYNTRMMRVLGYRRTYLRNKLLTFHPMVVMEDFHMTLQILRSGADTAVLNSWVSNQAGGSNAQGGCSTYRTEAVQTAAAQRLAALHPGFVRVVQKATKTAWGGGTRTDVQVQWKQARRSAE